MYVLNLISLLVQKYKSTNTDSEDADSVVPHACRLSIYWIYRYISTNTDVEVAHSAAPHACVSAQRVGQSTGGDCGRRYFFFWSIVFFFFSFFFMEQQRKPSCVVLTILSLLVTKIQILTCFTGTKVRIRTGPSCL